MCKIPILMAGFESDSEFLDKLLLAQIPELVIAVVHLTLSYLARKPLAFQTVDVKKENFLLI